MKTLNEVMEDIAYEHSEAEEKQDYKEIVRLMSKYYFLKKTRIYKQLRKVTI
jgi:hypothetical protein